jgi:F-type H+-transporting ATPase subunit gamma
LPTVQDIRRRIRSVKNTQQITRAMKMVAAARLRRAQERIFNARPYAHEMLNLLESIVARTGEREHPLLATRPIKKTLLVLITSDRGLCGAFNANLARSATSYLAEHPRASASLLVVGRKGRDAFRRTGVKIAGEYINIFRKLGFANAQEIAEEIIREYSDQAVDAVDVIYNEFKSIMTQRVTVQRFLPVAPIASAKGETPVDYIYEEPPEEIFRVLLPRYVEIEVYRALLESNAAEFAAKMTAMDAATNNAEELMTSLTLTMNRIRQAAITKEIIEVVSGADALRE